MTKLGRRIRGRAADDGSIPLALLGSIAVAGLVSVVVASTVAGERSVRFDQEFTGAIHVAEAGVETALHKLNTGQLSSEDSPVEQSGTIDGKDYEWTAVTEHEPGDPGPVEWTITSTGRHQNVTRTVKADISDEPLFNMGAFSDQMLAFSGGNSADSYDSSSGQWCTGNGRVGSNEDLGFGGSAQTGPCKDDYPRGDQTVDGVDLYDWASYADPARCDHSGGSNCYEGNDSSGTWYVQTHDERVRIAQDVDWMESALEECAQEGKMRSHVTTVGDEGGTLEPADGASGIEVAHLTEHGAGPGDRYAYCVDDLVFDGPTELVDAASADDPVVFLVGSSVTFEAPGGSSSDRAANIGCDAVDCSNSFDPRNVTPEAAALQIYTPADDAIDKSVVQAQNRWKIAAALYAPRGSCGGVTSNPQIDYFGSLVCGDIRNQGGWQFHYDDALGGAMRTGKFAVNRWGEQ